MELPSLSSLLPNEANAGVRFAPDDDTNYPPFYLMRFGALLDIACRLPPTRREKHVCPCPYHLTNYNEVFKGYVEWAVPAPLDEESDEDAMMHNMMQMMMSNQFKYGHLSGLQQPQVQVKQLFAKPIERQLQAFSKTHQFHELGSKIFVLKIELCPVHSSWKEDWNDRVDDTVKVWRLVTAFGDTNLDALHDQIIAPAMGWRRHYHAYKFLVPTSGACFGPQQSDAIDMMHATTSGSYCLDSEAYDLRHVLRKEGQRLCYEYDLGDSWNHTLTLVDMVDLGTTVTADTFQKDPQITSVLQDNFTMTLTGNHLLTGEVNCPPEDSNGCDGMGRYGNLLKKGTRHVFDDNAVNWSEHGIYNAYDFDLKAHQERFNQAVRRKKNPTDGNLQFVRIISPCVHDLTSFRAVQNQEKRRAVQGPGGESEILGKKKKAKVCANCSKQQGTNSGVNLQKCGRCKATWYCDVVCQRADWKRHKKVCQPKSMKH